MAHPIPPLIDSIFYRYDMAELCADFVQQLFVERLEETQVIMRYGNAGICFSTFDGTGSQLADRADCNDCQIVSVLQFPSFAHRNLFQRTFPVHQRHPARADSGWRTALCRAIGPCTSGAADSCSSIGEEMVRLGIGRR